MTFNKFESVNNT